MKRKEGKEAAAVWRNRIVGHGEADPKKLVANKWNFKVHSAMQGRSLEEAIGEVGYLRSVTVNKRTGHLVDGHLRVELALKRGVKTIAVEYVDLTEREERAALAALDPIAKLAGEDQDKLGSLIKALGNDAKEIRSIAEALVEDAGPDESEPDEEQVTFRRGADTLVKIGTYRFPVKRKKYQTWINALKRKTGHDEASVIGELKKRLGL